MRSAVLFIVAALSASCALAACPNLCNGHGRCGQNDKCTCFYGWTGADCSARTCKEGRAWVAGSKTDAHKYVECSNAGTCNRAKGLCDCNPGFEGEACDRVGCPNKCSGHGKCRYIEELSTYAASNWDSGKIQGCECDGGWEGIDCSKRRCPKGDDPLTVAADPQGQEWAVKLNLADWRTHDEVTATHVMEFALSLTSLAGETVVTRPMSWNASGAVLADALEFTGLVKSLSGVPTRTTPVGNLTEADHIDYSFTLSDPLRLTNIDVLWDSNCDTAGCFPRRRAMSPAGWIQGASAEVTMDVDSDAESAVCSNRGTCDSATGTCSCFTGYYGGACEMQTVLV